MSARSQLGFLFDAESPKIIQAQFVVEDEEVADPPGVVEEPPEEVPEPEWPTKKELERDGQLQLIDVGEPWEEAWKGMPEFVQKDISPYKTIYVHFENREDMEAFSQLVSQKIGLNTRSIWYPEGEIGRFSNKRFIDSAPPLEETEDVEVSEDGDR
jgi:hypothetical protein